MPWGKKQAEAREKGPTLFSALSSEFHLQPNAFAETYQHQLATVAPANHLFKGELKVLQVLSCE